MKRRQWILSVAIFVLIIAGIVSVDARVRDQFTQIMASGGGVSSWDDKAVLLGGAVATAIRYQSIENGPLLLFAVVGGVLFLFMVRT